MTSRVLPPEEWPKLVGTEADTLWPHLDPDNTQVIVVEDGDRIVGTWTAVRLVHAECVWVDPDYRGSFGVVKRLLRGMQRAARQWGARTVLTGSLTDQVSAFITSLGGQALPGEHFVIPVEQICQQR